jgi:hypothetical protein
MGAESLEVPLDKLVPVIRGLVRALAETQLGGGDIEATIHERLRVECVGCGIVLSGDELGHLAIDQETPAAEPAKLNRLRLGYCARSSCESRYYRIHARPTTGMDWPALLSRALELGNQPTPDPVPEEPPEPTENEKAPRPTTRRRLLLAGLALLAAAAIWHWWDDLPFRPEKPPKYQIDPNSLPRY